jgi:hypothetical protein
MVRALFFVVLVSYASMAHAIKVVCGSHEVKNAITIESHTDGKRKVFYVLFPKEYRGDKFVSASITVYGKHGLVVMSPLAAEPSSNQDWSAKLVAFVQTVNSTSPLAIEAQYGCTWRLTAKLSPQ